MFSFLLLLMTLLKQESVLILLILFDNCLETYIFSFTMPFNVINNVMY